MKSPRPWTQVMGGGEHPVLKEVEHGGGGSFHSPEEAGAAEASRIVTSDGSRSPGGMTLAKSP